MTITVDLWLWPLDAAGDAACLSGDEAARAARFVRPADATAFRNARAGLRRILGAYLDRPAADLAFSYGPEGKPGLPGGPAFNLSHSGRWAALAVTAEDIRLGIDIEAHRSVEQDVARRFFSPAEIAALARLSGPDWIEGFFQTWTRKEAFVKALGRGLHRPLDSFDVTLGPAPRIARIAEGGEADWQMADLATGPGYAGALAVEARGRPLRLALREGRLPLAP
ncbi:4'-phosphopantetheinyl transferase family protein [Solirhodobacter olei]|uniref:4'-phosphopantetheinyl transferase family protein n=1 Tax=Solirhodobacter olei TaxID=2493082 RepID=UPI000FD9BB09|nr:4'-phosphopantetheinyl transferase superfamily protein [Solirhodobacter olei]